MIIVSIVIPTKNGALTLRNCLNGIFSQTLVEALEVIIIDSGSTDETLKFVGEYPVRLYQIPEAEFNHGETRNYGVKLAKGEFIVMTVQDAVPANNFWLENLIKNFEDNDVVGVCGQQVVPHCQHTNPAQWFCPCSEPKLIKYHFKEKQEFLSLPLEKQRDCCSWENITAAYRRSILLEYPFKKTVTAEDLIWAKGILLSGKSIIYDAKACVYHYHHEFFIDYFKRIIVELYIDYSIFNIIGRDNLIFKRVLTATYLVIISDVGVWSTLKWILYNLKLILCRKLATALFFICTYISNRDGAEWLYSKFNKNFPIGKVKKK